MTPWKSAFSRAIWSGSGAGVLSGAALALCGMLERRAPAGPVNAPSQWVWGEKAARSRRASMRETGVGYTIHHTVSIGWATLHEKHMASLIEHRPFATRLLAATLTTAFAFFVDYGIARGRLRPGFEKQLSGRSLFVVYATFALGLAAGENMRSRRPARVTRARRVQMAATRPGASSHDLSHSAPLQRRHARPDLSTVKSDSDRSPGRLPSSENIRPRTPRSPRRWS